MRKTVKTAVYIIIGVIILALFLCPIFGVHIFTLNIKGKYVARVDCIEGYYVAVYEEDVCSHDGGLSMGNCDDITEYDWKHKEMLGLIAYRRVLCFSKETEPETYILHSEDGRVKYGTVYVLRTSGDTVHYYYQRECVESDAEISPYAFEENIAFNCNGKTYELKNHCSFSSDTDFTTGENILYMKDEPCFFVPMSEIIGQQ